MEMIVFNQIKAFAQGRCLPIIPIKAKDVTIIGDPDSFYNLIMSKIDSCKKRLALSALYLGTGSKERAIVQEISHILSKERDVVVNIVLDANRATRKDIHGASSITALDKLLGRDNVKLSLVETRPHESTFGRFLRNFQKWNELSSTYHTKFLVFDSDVITTGANLSSIYFEHRQDRYVLIRNSKLFSDYVSNLLDVFDCSLDSTNKSMMNRLRTLNEQFCALSDESAASDSYIIPLVQLGSLGLTDKEDFLLYLSSILPPEARIHLSSGYFNPSGPMSSVKIDSVLAPSENANGFFSGRGLLKFVPRLYSALHQQYLDHHQDCKLFYYDRPNWSFHAKGVWVTGLNDLYIHLVGSSNFNHRSSERDLETECVLLTRDKDLSRRLDLERVQLWSESYQCVRSSGFSTLISKLVANAFKSFL